jgi:hypothetical protein
MPPVPGGRPPFVDREGYWVWAGSMALLVLGIRALGTWRLSKAQADMLLRGWDD